MAIFLKLENVDVLYPQGYFIGKDRLRYGGALFDGFNETTFFESEGRFEVILLSESQNDMDSFMGLRRGTETWDSYNVMVIEWHWGVAERRGLGKVPKSAVHQSFSPGPVWKEIVLG
jgi:hypothetical protein